ncbi:MAG TPA: prepilin-type N-terminal cleavage/methylation domain-containing protein [Verrucomicrobia bacterium]|nr:prepilin-type N-terminal cleavage/methylation domain-containing protein [Verrucomicrobiota bacterium]
MKNGGSIRRKPDGFTLIDLLVVIAIIAILAGLLLPVLNRAKEAGRRSHCVKNLRHIGLGIRMDQDEFDNHFPKSEMIHPKGSFLINRISTK